MADSNAKKAALAKKKAAAKKEEKKHPRDMSSAERREAILKARGDMGADTDWQVLKTDDNEKLIPYGMLVYDHVLRLQGIGMRGRVSQHHGDEGCGKSTTAYCTVRNYQRETGEPAAIFDFERGCSVAYLKALGADTSPEMLFLKQPSSVEDCQKDTIRLMQAGVRLFVYDSIPRMKSMVDVAEILNGNAFKASYGTHAKSMSQFYDNMMPHLSEIDGHFLMVNQTRDRIEEGNDAKNAQKYPSFANMPYNLPGGRSCRFQPSVMIEHRKVMKDFKPGPQILRSGGTPDEFIIEPITSDNKDARVVQRMRVRVLKNRVGGGGYREGYIWIRPFGVDKTPGLDENMCVRELARDYGLIEFKGKKWVVGDDDNVIATYADKKEAIQDLVIDENPDVLGKLSLLTAQYIDADSSTRFAADIKPDGNLDNFLGGGPGTEDPEENEKLTVSKAFEIDEEV